MMNQKNLLALAAIFLSVAMLAGTAWAQDDMGMEDEADVESSMDDDTSTTVTAAPEPEPAPAPAPAPAPSVTGSDFNQTMGSWGFQVTQVFPGVGLAAAAAPALGVRKWNDENSGWEAGVAFRVVRTGGADSTDLLFGGNFGYLMGLATFDHMNVFFEPGLSLFVGAPDVGDTQWIITAFGAIGAEVRLGMIGLPRIGITTRLSAGISFGDTTGDVDILFGTFGQENGGLDGLWEGTVGFIFYM